MAKISTHFGSEKAKPLTDEQKSYVKKLDKAIDNSFSTIQDGISTMASVVAKIAAEDDLNADLMSDNNLANITWLIEELANTCGYLDLSGVILIC